VRRCLGALLVPVPVDDKDLLDPLLVDIMDLLELDNIVIIIMLRPDDCDVNRNKWGATGILPVLLVPQLPLAVPMLLS
jgi:hypothetical protein